MADYVVLISAGSRAGAGPGAGPPYSAVSVAARVAIAINAAQFLPSAPPGATFVFMRLVGGDAQWCTDGSLPTNLAGGGMPFYQGESLSLPVSLVGGFRIVGLAAGAILNIEWYA